MKQDGTGVTGEDEAFRRVVGHTAQGPVTLETPPTGPYDFGRPGRGKMRPPEALPGDGEVVWQ